MEVTQPAPDQGFRDRRARRHVFGQPRVEARGEWNAAPRAIAAHGVSDRPFGRDMYRVRLQRLDPSGDGPGPGQRAADVRIGRQWKGTKAFVCEKRDLGAVARCDRSQRRQCAHHAIDLRMPCIGCDEDAHHVSPVTLCSNRMRHDAPRMSQFCDGQPQNLSALLENCRE